MEEDGIPCLEYLDTGVWAVLSESVDPSANSDVALTYGNLENQVHRVEIGQVKSHKGKERVASDSSSKRNRGSEPSSSCSSILDTKSFDISPEVTVRKSDLDSDQWKNPQTQTRRPKYKPFTYRVAERYDSLENISFSSLGRRLEHSQAELDLSRLNGESLPAFTYDRNGQLPEPRKNYSYTSMSERFKGNQVKEKPSFTSLPESADGQTVVNYIFDSAMEDLRICKRLNCRRGKSDCKSLTCYKESEEEERYSSISEDEDIRQYPDRTSTLDSIDRMTNKLNKYEIPSFYVFHNQMDSSSDGSRCISDRDFYSAGEDDPNYVMSVRNDDQLTANTRPVSKFTLPVSRADAGAKTKSAKKPSPHIGQGDPPWTLVGDGASESDGEEATLAAVQGRNEAWNQYDVIETLTSEPSHIELQNNIKNAALNNKSTVVQSEGKISRFFSRLRKSPSTNSADLRQPPDVNGKDPYNTIISHEDNQSAAKKQSKMCTIL